MANKLMYNYIPNYDTQNYPFCRVQLLVEKFGHNQLKLNKSPESCLAKE